MELMSSEDGGWWQGSCNNESGFFPASYAQVCLLSVVDICLLGVVDIC